MLRKRRQPTKRENKTVKKVSKSDFYAKMIMDVMPRVDESTLKGRFFVSYWELRNREIIGKTISDSWGIEDGEYFLYI